MPAATDGQSDRTSSNRACSVIDAIQQIGSEWRLVVLHDLQEEAAPIAAYYRLTPKGRSLCPVFDEIEAWADEWQEAP